MPRTLGATRSPAHAGERRWASLPKCDRLLFAVRAGEADGKRMGMEVMASDSIQAAVDLLQSWLAGDEIEQRETWEYLKRQLDADRLSDRRLFP